MTHRRTLRLLGVAAASALLLAGCTSGGDTFVGVDHGAGGHGAASVAGTGAAGEHGAEHSGGHGAEHSAGQGAPGSAAMTATVAPPASDATVIAPGRPGEDNRTLTGAEAVPPTREPSEADVSFMQDMIVHHAQAVVMVDMTDGRLQDRQVAAIAARIGDEQLPEMGGMAKWLSDRGHAVPPQAADPHGDHADHADHSGMAGMATPEQLEQLRLAPPDEVDQLFLQLMIRHHEGAIEMVVERAASGTDPQVEALANDMGAVQQVQINQMQGMLDRLG